MFFFDIRHTVLAESSALRGLDASEVLDIQGLDATHGGIRSVLVFPTRYRPISQFVTINEGAVTSKIFVLPVDPEKVLKIDAPDPEALPNDLQALLKNSPKVEGLEGQDWRRSVRRVSQHPKAGLYIYTKMPHTIFANKRSVFTYVNSLNRIRATGFLLMWIKICETRRSIRSHPFHDVSGELHTPSPNFVLLANNTGPLRQFDNYGNLQLTFFSNPATLEFVKSVLKNSCSLLQERNKHQSSASAPTPILDNSYAATRQLGGIGPLLILC